MYKMEKNLSFFGIVMLLRSSFFAGDMAADVGTEKENATKLK